MKTDLPARSEPKFRKDYQPPRYLVDRVDLSFELSPSNTRVECILQIRRNPIRQAGPLELDGEALELLSLSIDDWTLSTSEYSLSEDRLVIEEVPDQFSLRSVVRIDPESNTSFTGLYRSSGNFCTQCEAEGFRRITFFPDRPDVLSTYTTTIIADPTVCPVMLSNGNKVGGGSLDDGRHWVRWEDPFRKPSYLFALVAGDLRAARGTFTTRSGREVQLEVWVEPRNLDKCAHALRSLQRAMKWDEDVFGLEYDLDVYMIVAVNDFNMGAMENKGLNIFNSKYVLAKSESATDTDFENIEAVIAHEYFHNWTGNRVTCRDWFQLTLKEGLTVFRDQQFTADMTSSAVKRIHDVRALRAIQFEEDAGPMKHPIRPDSYVEMNNFYTSTVYNKGAEVVRLFHTMLGQEGFRRGLDLYFRRHDGQAVTCDDFRMAMADANQLDLSRMERWYRQAGTPGLRVESAWDPSTHETSVTMTQRAPEGATDWEPVPIPVRSQFLSSEGRPLTARLRNPDGSLTEPCSEHMLLLEESTQAFAFRDVPSDARLSVLRGFSAPVRLEDAEDLEDLAFRFAHEDDPFNKWDAGQRMFESALLRMIQRRGVSPELVEPSVTSAFGEMLSDGRLDPSLKALAIQLPPERTLAQRLTEVDPDVVHAARRAVQLALLDAFRPRLEELYDEHRSREPYRFDQASVARRRLAQAALGLLSVGGTPNDLARAHSQFRSADNMTDAEGALFALADHECAERDACLSDFYARWSEEPLVVDKWFAVQASSRAPGTLDKVEALFDHTAFSLRNPNRVRSLVGTFAVNALRFHDASGRGYAFVERAVSALDRTNPQVASRLVSSFNSYRRYESGRRELMKACLERIAERAASKDVTEIVTKALSK
ncbi:MAG: aminopeptidase N [Myxococcota bacterium]